MASWEDFLSSFDKAQDEVKTHWGPEQKTQGRPNYNNFGKPINGPDLNDMLKVNKPAKKLDAKTQDKINKLTAVINCPGATAGEKDNARRLINKLMGV